MDRGLVNRVRSSQKEDIMTATTETATKKKATKKSTKDVETIALEQFKRETMFVKIVGTSNLVTHRFGEKARKQIEDKQQKKGTKAKEARDPDKEFNEARHLNDDGADCFPASGFKKALVRAGTYCDMKMTFLRGAFHVIGDLVPIEYSKISMRTDNVRIPSGADIRYRPEYHDWTATLQIQFNSGVISKEQIINLLDVAGFSVGIGEMRPEKGYQYGMFAVEGTQ